MPQVQEYFGDFVALEPHHFLVPLPRPHLAMQPFSWDFGNSSDAIARMTEGVASLMLSLRRRFLIRCAAAAAACQYPCQRMVQSAEVAHVAGYGDASTVAACCEGMGCCAPGSMPPYLPACLPTSRPGMCSYQRGSEICERFSQSLHHLTAIEERELFDFGNRGEPAPVLLILDRRDDPVTPLLSQWTYQVRRRPLGGRQRGLAVCRQNACSQHARAVRLPHLTSAAPATSLPPLFPSPAR